MKTKFKQNLLFLFVLTHFFSPKCLVSQCNELLKHGIYDYEYKNSNQITTESYINWLKNKSISTYQNAKNEHTNIGISLDDIFTDFGYSKNETGFQQYKTYYENYIYQNSSNQSKLQTSIKKINPDILKAWTKCINSFGLHIWIQHTQNPFEFIIYANYIDDGSGGTPPKITSIDFGTAQDSITTNTNIFINNGRINPNMILNNQAQGQIFRRTSNKAFTLLINTNVGMSVPFAYSFNEIKNNSLKAAPDLVIRIFEVTSTERSRKPSATVTVDKGYKIIGGGARVNYKGRGCLMTECYPINLQTWKASAKAHISPDNATITVFAIAIYDPNDIYDVRIFSNIGLVNKHPEAEVSVDEGYILTGGGAKNNWSTNGNLLTASFPVSSTTWKAKGKDHVAAEPTAITVYAIGIKTKENYNKKLVNRIIYEESELSNRPSFKINILDSYIMTCGGVIANWRIYGSLLTSSYPLSPTQWFVSSKDHREAERVKLGVYLIGIKFE